MNLAGAMELRIVKPSFKYTAGQWLFIQVPEISRWQWHPVGSRSFSLSNCSDSHIVRQFTITSAPEDPYVSVHIRQVGDFTRALGERLGAGPSVVAAMTPAAMKGAEVDDKDRLGTRGDFIELDANAATKALPQVRIDGPYGAPAEDVFSVEVAVLVGAGIGEPESCSSFIKRSCKPFLLFRCNPIRIYSQTYLVPPKEGETWLTSSRRVLLGLSRCSILWLVPKSAPRS